MMKIKHLGFCMILGLASSVALTELGGNNLASAAPAALSATSSAVYSPVQSTYRPSNWQLWDPVQGQVQVCNSDANSQDFMANQPSFMKIINSNVSEGMKYTAASQNAVDVQRLYLFSDYAPRIYFLMDGGASTSALGVTIGPAAPLNGQPPAGSNYLVFPNANSSYSNSYKTQPNGRTQTVPMFSGDFVQLPTVKKGQELALVLFGHLDSNGNPTQTYYIDPKANADNFQHAVAFFPLDSRYIIVAWENTPGGGDADFNDTIIVVDVGQANADYLKTLNSTLPK